MPGQEKGKTLDLPVKPAWRTTGEGYPLIAGRWAEWEERGMFVDVRQHGAEFLATMTYKEGDETVTVFDVVRVLAGRVAAMSRKLHSPDCCYRERRESAYVLLFYGVSWDDLWRLLKVGVLPLGHVLRLLDILLTGTPREEAFGYGRISRRWRRRLVRLLRTAFS